MTCSSDLSFRVIQTEKRFGRNIGLFAVLIDFMLIVAASNLAGLCHSLIFYHDLPAMAPFISLGVNAAMLFVLIERSRGGYRATELSADLRRLGTVASSWLIALLTLSSLLFFSKIGDNYSRGAIAAFAFIALAFLFLSRAFLGAQLRAMAMSGPRAIVLGIPEELSKFSIGDLCERHGMREIRRYVLPTSGFTADQHVIEEVINLARTVDAERVVLALPWSDPARCHSIAERLRVLPLPVQLLPDSVARTVVRLSSNKAGFMGLVEINPAPLSNAQLALKRTFDVVIAGSAVLLLLPLLAVVALVVKLESHGPILFRQDRVGFNGRKFTIFKFRTMLVEENGDVIRQASRNDDRVTVVGRVLRRTSLDELPQLINVLQGTMSIVGPRPHALAHHAQFGDAITSYAFRHNVKPGITGWAQINGLRGETPQLEQMRCRVEYDLWYIRNWNLLLDLRILIRTFIVLLHGKNAY